MLRKRNSCIIVICVVLLFIYSCQNTIKVEEIKSFVSEDIKTYYHNVFVPRTKVFIQNNEENGWYIDFNKDGSRKEEGIVLSNGNFSKYYYYEYASNGYGLKTYFMKNGEKRIQQFKYFDENINFIDSLGSFVTVSDERQDTITLRYFHQGCKIDSFKIFDKYDNVYSSLIIDSIQSLSLSKQSTMDKNFLLNYFWEPASGMISERRLILNFESSYFNKKDIDLLHYVKNVRDVVDVNTFFDK